MARDAIVKSLFSVVTGEALAVFFVIFGGDSGLFSSTKRLHVAIIAHETLAGMSSAVKNHFAFAPTGVAQHLALIGCRRLTHP